MDDEGNHIAVLPICLPWGDNDPGCNKQGTSQGVTLAGWGATSYDVRSTVQAVRNIFQEFLKDKISYLYIIFLYFQDF